MTPEVNQYNVRAKVAIALWYSQSGSAKLS
jgi:hypothetical protein